MDVPLPVTFHLKKHEGGFKANNEATRQLAIGSILHIMRNRSISNTT